MILKSRIALAPMAGVADAAFREICAEFGAGLVVTEMVSAKGLYHNSAKTRELLFTPKPLPCPVSAQIFGHEADIIKEILPEVLKFNPSMIDINSGCPTPKIVRNGDGAAMLKDLTVFENVVSAATSASPIPVSVKIRSGWDAEHIYAAEAAKIAEKAGVAMITVHGRTAVQGYSGKSDWDVIKSVVNAVNCPVIGNGDVDSPEKAKEMLEHTGCAAVMVGRAALGNPYIFGRIARFLEFGELMPEPTAAERVETGIKHIKKIIEYKGERIGTKESRKHAMWYIKGLNNSTAVKNKICTAKTFEEISSLMYEVTANA